MERHIKQQHPQHWCQKPRGSRRNHAATVPVIAPQFRSSNENEDSESENKLEIDDERCMEENQQNGNGTMIKDKNSRGDSQISENCQNNEDMENSGDEGEEEEEEEGFEVGSDNGEDGSLIIDEPSTSSTGNGQEDLASVSKLLNTASAQSFQKVSFFSIGKYQVCRTKKYAIQKPILVVSLWSSVIYPLDLLKLNT